MGHRPIKHRKIPHASSYRDTLECPLLPAYISSCRYPWFPSTFIRKLTFPGSISKLSSIDSSKSRHKTAFRFDTDVLNSWRCLTNQYQFQQQQQRCVRHVCNRFLLVWHHDGNSLKVFATNVIRTHVSQFGPVIRDQ